MTESRWKVWAPALLLLAIAATHCTIVVTHSASRWRVGGMGMYTEPHPNARDLVFVRGEHEVRGRSVDDACTDGYDLHRRAVTHPFDAHIEAFARACITDDLKGWTAKLVVPRVDPTTRQITHEVVREVSW